MPSLNKIVAACAAAMFFSSTLATPTIKKAIDLALYPYIAPIPTDSRGPCMALNALANQGLLPRDGKNIDLAMALAASEYMGMGWQGASAVFNGALATSKTGNKSTLNLGDFAQHEPQAVEYDASISRTDAYFGDPGPFNQTVWDRSQSSWAPNSDLITFSDAHRELRAREAWAKANNPQYKKFLGKVGDRLNYANLFYAFGSPTDGNANRKWVKYLVEKERLPIELGWSPPPALSDLVGLGALIIKIEQASV